jgi:phenylpyruvate tautomerase PptA (4-oxalocrotonate tautomerase family)
MPVLFINGPSGVPIEAKKELVEKTIAALVDAYQMPDDRVYINEFPNENGGHTGHTHRVGLHHSDPVMPVCFVEAPPGIPIETKRKLIGDITSAVASAYQIDNLRDILIFLREYPLENVAVNSFLQSENPEFPDMGN